MKHLPFQTGCNNIIFKYLKSAANEMKDEKDLFCILLWDEMSIKSAVEYNIKKDIIIGFEDWGVRRTRKFADHAILFYLRCLASGNHMPLGYGFCYSTTSTVQLARCIKEYLRMIIQAGFKPVGTVCDQGATNIGAINFLINETHLKQHMVQRNRSK